MNRSYFLLLLAAMLPLSAPAAEKIDFSYFDVAVTERDGGAEDFEGLGMRGSLPLGPQLFAAAELFMTSNDNFDRTDVSFGLGYRVPLNRSTDVFTQLDYINLDNEETDEGGLRLGAGVRSLVMPQLEVRGALRYVDVVDGELLVELGAQYIINNDLAAFLEVTDGDVFGGATIGARFSF